MSSQDVPRVLGVSESTSGIGFAVLEGPGSLIDWGTHRLGASKRGTHLRRARELLRRSQPDVVVLQDIRDDSRRGEGVKERLSDLESLANSLGITTVRYTRVQVRACFRPYLASSKDEIAEVIAKEFPEIRARLPRRRKPWMSEDLRIQIFSALALGLTHYWKVEA